MKAKGKTKGVFYRKGIAYIRYVDAEGKERKESTRQGSTAAARRLLEKRKTRSHDVQALPRQTTGECSLW